MIRVGYAAFLGAWSRPRDPLTLSLNPRSLVLDERGYGAALVALVVVLEN